LDTGLWNIHELIREYSTDLFHSANLALISSKLDSNSYSSGRKRFGQKLLHDPAIIERIVQVVNPRPGQRLVEIGPGKGAITFPLLAACKHLEVIELDRDLVQPAELLVEFLNR